MESTESMINVPAMHNLPTLNNAGGQTTYYVTTTQTFVTDLEGQA